MAKIYIAGAHSRGITMGHYLQYLEPLTEIKAYLYDNDEKNPESINGVPVIKINENSALDTNCPVYLGMRGVNHSHITEILKKCGMKIIIPVNVELDLDVRNRYLEKYFHSLGRRYVKINDIVAGQESKEREIKEDYIEFKKRDYLSAKIYVTSSVFDKPLHSEYYLASYEELLQVGTELTDKRFDTDYFDNTGDNISLRNKQFCELTGLYWIWKNATEDIVGMVHYRRHFILPDEWKGCIVSNDIDVILPLPLYVGPTLESNYKMRHNIYPWENMLQFVRENYNNEFNALKEFFAKTSLYSPCNMFIMKREVLNELCMWMFPILFFVAEKVGTIEDPYQNRYPGFLSERLISYYFDAHKDKYKVVYADKNFLQ